MFSIPSRQQCAVLKYIFGNHQILVLISRQLLTSLTGLELQYVVLQLCRLLSRRTRIMTLKRTMVPTGLRRCAANQGPLR